MSEASRNRAEWENPANWSRWGTYRSSRDTRVFVPSRIRFFRWTMNFVHPQAGLWLIAVMVAGGIFGGALGVVVEIVKAWIRGAATTG